jgi:hypothetical protein
MGIEPAAIFPENPVVLVRGGAESGAPDLNEPAPDPELESVIDAWPTLPEPIKAAVKALVWSVAGRS